MKYFIHNLPPYSIYKRIVYLHGRLVFCCHVDPWTQISVWCSFYCSTPSCTGSSSTPLNSSLPTWTLRRFIQQIMLFCFQSEGNPAKPLKNCWGFWIFGLHCWRITLILGGGNCFICICSRWLLPASTDNKAQLISETNGPILMIRF